MTPTDAQTVRELIEAAKDALDETVDARTYPDGPCMNKETRDALRTAYRAAEALLARDGKPKNPSKPNESSMVTPAWPCQDNCAVWCRSDIAFKDGKPLPATNHHPRCKYVDASLIDVWKVSLEGTSYYVDREYDAIEAKDRDDEVEISHQKMHKEMYDQLPEFHGF